MMCVRLWQEAQGVAGARQQLQLLEGHGQPGPGSAPGLHRLRCKSLWLPGAQTLPRRNGK